MIRNRNRLLGLALLALAAVFAVAALRGIHGGRANGQPAGPAATGNPGAECAGHPSPPSLTTPEAAPGNGAAPRAQPANSRRRLRSRS